MANPSLQIGNSNWAIKEDDLLGYSTVGTNYLPKPMTMTRASAGTRVNSQGLVETVELLGSEEVTDGNFPTPNTAWDLSPTFTIADNKLHCVSDGSYQYANQSAMVVGKTYRITFDITGWVSGNVRVRPSGQSPFQLAGSNGSYIFYYTAVSNSVITIERNGTPTDLYIENISVKEVTRDNLARVDYDGTSSLLVEPQRTNLVTYSEDFSDSSWSKSDVNVLTNQTNSPQGIQNAAKITENTNNAEHRVQFSFSQNASTNYSVSVFVKSNGRDYFSMNIGASRLYANFDLINETVTQVNSNGTAFNNESASISSYGNGWYKCVLSGYAITTSGGYVRLCVRKTLTSGNNQSYTGDGVSGLYLWGAQLEVGSYATSYIPNFGTALGVTRVQETYEKTGISNLINSEEGVLFVEMAAFSESNLNSYITIGQNTSNGILGISFYTGSNNILLDHWEGASETYHIESISDITEFNKIAICYNGTSIKGYINGSPVWNTTVTAWSSNALSELNFAFGNSGTNKFSGKVKQLQVFKTALTDTELATLTQ